jgi:anti-sigma factor RsiW
MTERAEHVTDTEIEEFALGELSAARLPGFEVHVSSCDECAGRLAREARLELALAQVARSAPPAPAAPATRRALISRRSAAALATFALAAAVLLLFLRGAGEPSAPSITPSVVCADGPDQIACVQRAQRHGRFLQYPDWAGPPPFGAGDSSAGPSVAPFPAADRQGP